MRLLGVLLTLTTTSVLAAPLCGSAPKTVTLFNSTLATAQVTDQAGLNTCGANALSTVLQSALKSQRPISYLDLAFQSAKQEWGSQYNPMKQFVLEGGRRAYEGMTDLCASVQTLKQNGGVCAREKVSYESAIYEKWGKNDTDKRQAELLNALTAYLDKYYAFQFSPAVRTKDLTKVFEYVSNKRKLYEGKCQGYGEGKNSISLAATFSSVMEKTALWIENNRSNAAQKSCVVASEKYLNSFVAGTTRPFVIRPEVLEKFRKTYNDSVMLAQWKSGVISGAHNFSILVAHYLDQQSATFPKEKSLLVACDLASKESEHPLSGVKLYQPELTNEVVKELKATYSFQECVKRGVQDSLNTTKTKADIEALLAEKSGASELTNLIRLLPLWEQDPSTFLNKLAPNKEKNLDMLSALLAPSCSGNRMGLEALTCEKFTMVQRNQQIPLAEVRAKYREVAESLLNKGTAVATVICDEFVSKDTSATIDTCQYNETGYHVVAITGYRCNKGAIEYELTNSWGTHCPVKNGTKDKNIECILDAKGLPTGRYWVKEDVLMKNVHEFNKISG